MKITEYAALSLGGADWSKAFSQAMDDLRAQGGGVLTVPAGVYPTGPIELFSHITLEVQAGAELRCGAMVTGLQDIGGEKYYFAPNGDMQTGWVKLDGDWWYFTSSGAAKKSGSLKIGSKDYWFRDYICLNP